MFLHLKPFCQQGYKADNFDKLIPVYLFFFFDSFGKEKRKKRLRKDLEDEKRFLPLHSQNGKAGSKLEGLREKLKD